MTLFQLYARDQVGIGDLIIFEGANLVAIITHIDTDPGTPYNFLFLAGTAAIGRVYGDVEATVISRYNDAY